MNSIFSRPGVRLVNQAALAGLGGISHPRISIRGGTFSLHDASGQSWPAPIQVVDNKPVMLGIIIGANGNKSKMYFRDGWDPDNTSPPTCFSDNGVAPSSESSEPQAATCAECPLNRWGSEVSRMTRKGIKACHDKKKIAVRVIGDPTGLVYELQVPPASLKALGSYAGSVGAYSIPGGGRNADLCDFVTVFSFVPQQTGMLEFAPMCWVDSVQLDRASGQTTICFNPQGEPVAAPDGGAEIAGQIDEIWASGQIDELVGLKDKPYTGQITAQPQATPQLPAAQPAGHAPPQQPVQGHVVAAPGAYAPPEGAAPAQPQQAFPSGGAAPSQAQPAPRGGRGGARPGAGRRPATAGQNVVPMQPAPAGQSAGVPAAQPAPVTSTVVEDADIPQFLRRQQSAPAPAQPAQPAPAAAPQPSHPQSGMVNAPPVPSGIGAALKTAFSLRT